MAEQAAVRKLAAILAADVAGYSRLMADDEAATVRTLTEYREVFAEHVERHRGRVVDTSGDSVLAVFESPVEAVACAERTQRELARRNGQLAAHRRMEFRIGVNLGDVIFRDDGTIYGDGVNVAARLESLADPGGVMISESAHMQVHGKLDLGLANAGAHRVKNIREPVRAFRVVTGGKPRATPTRRLAPIAAAIVLVALVGAAAWLARAPVPEPTADPVLALPDGPAIAVLPFENLSGDPEQAYFGDGLTEDLITRLSRFPGFFVIARNSTYQYKGRSVDVREVGRELGARYVVEGSVRRAADTVRVAVQLLDSKDGTHMWAETYDRELTAAGLFEVQDEITERVAATIADSSGILWRADMAAIKGKPTDSLDAYECVLRQVAYYDAVSPAEHLAVRDCLERAVELDPDYAGAWSSLAFVYLDEYRFGFNPRPDSLDRALEAARRAAALDAASADARNALATVHFHRHELEAFFAEAERAIALNPNNATVLANLGSNLVFAGEAERGAALVEKAAALNPNHPDWYYFSLTLNRYLKREYREALDLVLKIHLPDFFWTHALRAMVYGELGREAEARAAAGRLLELYPGFAENAWLEWHKWNIPKQAINRLVEGLRKAGLDIVPPPSASH